MHKISYNKPKPTNVNWLCVGTLSNDLEQFFKILDLFGNNGGNHYEEIGSLKLFGTKQYVAQGLSPEEANLYAHFENSPGKALVIGCSAGRECVYLARKGWKIIGIDFVKNLINIGRTFACRMGLDIDYRVLNLKDLDENTFSGEKFDFIAFSILPLIPTQKLRKKILSMLHNYLVLNGKVAVIFQARRVNYRMTNPVLKVLLKLLKPTYEEGDYFAFGYLHVFTEKELEDEVAKSGFAVKDMAIGPIYKWALLEKV